MTSMQDLNWEYIISRQRKTLSLYNKELSFNNLDFNQTELIDEEGLVYKLIGPEAELYIERLCEDYCLIQLWILELTLYPHRSRKGLMFLDLNGSPTHQAWYWYPYSGEKQQPLRELASVSYYVKSDWYRYK